MTSPHVPPEAVPLPGALETTLALITAMVAVDDGDDDTLRQLLGEADEQSSGVVPLLVGLVGGLLGDIAEREGVPPQEAWRERAIALTTHYMAGD